LAQELQVVSKLVSLVLTAPVRMTEMIVLEPCRATAEQYFGVLALLLAETYDLPVPSVARSAVAGAVAGSVGDR
jgi:hypothetical protein